MDNKTYTARQKGLIALVMLAFVFASMGLFVRYLSTGFGLLQQVYLRVVAAAVLSFIIFRKDIHLEKIRKLTRREWSLLTVRAMCMYGLGVVLFSQAILSTKYSNVSFIGALPLTAVFGVLILKEKITLKKVLYILAAFAGTIIISVNDFSNILIWERGEVLALIATIGFTFSYVLRKGHTNLLNNKEITVLILGIAFIILFTTSFLLGEPLPTGNWSPFLFGIVLTAGFANVINLFLTNYGFQHVEAVLASNILTLESVFAIALGLLFFQEIPSLKELIGGALITASVIGINRETV